MLEKLKSLFIQPNPRRVATQREILTLLGYQVVLLMVALIFIVGGWSNRETLVALLIFGSFIPTFLLFVEILVLFERPVGTAPDQQAVQSGKDH